MWKSLVVDTDYIYLLKDVLGSLNVLVRWLLQLAVIYRDFEILYLS